MQIKQLLAVAIIILIVSSSLIILLFENKSKKKSANSIIRVAGIVDSITEYSHYPDYLQTMLGDNYLVKNFGVASSTVLLSSDKP